MPDIRLQRTHDLGLPKARRIAAQWADEVRRKFDMECTLLEGETADTVEFRRTGISGRLTVSADRFDLQARLGLLLGAFAGRIEAEIAERLDRLLASESKS